MTLTKLLDVLPTNTRLAITPEFKIATGRNLVGFGWMTPEQAQHVIDNFGYLGYGDKDAKCENKVISVYVNEQWSPTFRIDERS